MIKAIHIKGVLDITYSDIVFKDGQELLLKVLKDDRTTKQNALLWKYFQIISEFTGDSKESVHDDVLRHLNKTVEEINTKTGEVRTRLMRTSTMNKYEFAELIDEIVKVYGEMYGLEFPNREDF